MSAGYQKAARVLRDLDSVDREWLLAQFTTEERERLEDAMASEGVSRAPVAAVPGAKTHRDAFPDERPAASKLAAADVETVERLLHGEPDWIVAVVLMHTAWPWLPKYLGRRPVAELDRIQDLARQLESRVKWSVRNAMIEACADRLEAFRPAEPASSPFDRLVEAARRQMESERPAVEGQ